MRFAHWIAGFALVAVTGLASADDNWPLFRGPASLGTSDTSGLPTEWSATENVAWKTDLPGRGWSSPVVWGNRVFLTTVINHGQEEVQRPGLYLGGERPEPSKEPHEWCVLCLDLNSGSILWQKTAHEGPPNSSIHLKNTYASETPVTDGERVYAYFGNVGIFCYTVDGEPVWQQLWDPVPTANGWGTGASPTLDGDRLYVQNDNEKQSYLVAIDARTGKEVWRVERPEKSSWSTPFVWHHAGRTEIIASGSGVVRSYDLEGHELWHLSGMSHNAIPTPFEHQGLLYVASGHVMSNLKPLMAIRPGGSGDISLEKKATSNQFVAWCQRMAAPYNPSPLAYQAFVYVLTDGGMFACYRANDGTQVYSKKRIPDGKMFTSSPWAYDDKVFCLNENGVTFVMQPGEEFKVLSTNKLAEDDMCLATPAIVGHKLLVRSSVRLYCLEVGKHLAEAK